ncbi:MAG TPA: AMP-binding protein [Azospirillaceae bacterium]|nr:AMP-binding protein [Azospirillaceae bacterium]
MQLKPSAHRDSFTRDHLPPPEQWPLLLFDRPEFHWPDRLNCAVELLDRAVGEGHGDRPAILCGDGVWTYAQVRDTADRIARVLVEDQGLVPGNRVLLRAANTPMLFACWFAVMKAGLVAVTTMPMLRAGELAQVIDKARVDLALCDAALTTELHGAALDGKPLRVVTFGAPGADLERLVAGKPAGFQAVETSQDDVCLLAFTSGTTGQPKACMHFHRDIMAMCDGFAKHMLDPQPDEIFTGTPPIAFTFGLGGLLAFPFRFRAAVALPDKAGPTALADCIQRHRATTVFTSPTGYRAMLGQRGEYDLSSLRKCVSAGEALPAATSDAWFEATGIRIVDGIGSTEMIHIFISARGDDIRPGATGLPLPGYQAALLDEEGRELDGPATGRLAVRGPVGCRYMADERQRNYVQGGWNVTGDTYRRDGDGRYWFVARADDMIVSAGYNIAGPEVEQALLAHPAVAECAVVGAPDPERGRIVKAFVVPAAGFAPGDALARELQDFVKARIAPYKYPRAVAFLDALPKTQTGKIQRFRLREREEADATAGV